MTETSCLTQPVVHPFIRFISQTYVRVIARSVGWLGALKNLFISFERESLFLLRPGLFSPSQFGIDRIGESTHTNVHLKWVRYNKRNGARIGDDNRVRSMAGRRVRKNFECPIPGGNGSRQSAPDATSFPVP